MVLHVKVLLIVVMIDFDNLNGGRNLMKLLLIMVTIHILIKLYGL